MAHLALLPPEILHNIFRWLGPVDLLLLPFVCRIFRHHVEGNRALFHDAYRLLLDVPGEDVVLDWEAEVRRVARLESICRRATSAEKKPELEFVSETVDRLLRLARSHGRTTDNSHTHAVSYNAELLARLFKEPSTRDAFLHRSFLFERVRGDGDALCLADPPNREHQLSAKLHCLYGRPILNLGRLRSTRTYPFAVSKVYDLRHYTTRTRWGPFLNDGSDGVDWEKVEAILIVLGYNLTLRRVVKLFADVWDSPFSGNWPRSYVSSPGLSLRPLEASDPYGVTGTWYRVICFLDFNDFFKFNFPVGPAFGHASNVPRPPLNVGEATRLIVMRIHVTSVEPPGPEDGQSLPVVHFKGMSRSLDDSWDDNANSDIRALACKGTVRLTRQGEVRWTTVSIVHGEERWRSEGVQLGGVQSARGVVGNWFDNGYDDQGPAGPTAFWKATDSKAASDTIHDLFTDNFLVAYNTMAYMEDSDPEAEMDYEVQDDDDEEAEVDEDIDSEPIASEIPGLLLDAQLDVGELRLTELLRRLPELCRRHNTRPLSQPSI
ncbi:hypothetical protein XA68_12220 [Ophiocordyceps unilateralis]|uniref:F-box domain-containing protein n=1 Tax=Ophiocordyceps unilateralis TaxID=268505 RepID=A0A2A9PF56_OPHUN|nr:hypothetical protein XA68_12220 [Ophiocordyceps unilateralis]